MLCGWICLWPINRRVRTSVLFLMVIMLGLWSVGLCPNWGLLKIVMGICLVNTAEFIALLSANDVALVFLVVCLRSL